MRTFDDLVHEAATVDVSGWGFDWLDGRATEERQPWGYSRLIAARLPEVTSALDIDTGGGELIAELPFTDASFELVISRHPVDPPWREIARVLTDGGTYLAQHVGPASAFELIEWFLGPLPRQRLARDPEREAAAARAAGLRIVDLRTARCRMELFDIGAVVYPLRKCVWWVPDFTASWPTPPAPS